MVMSDSDMIRTFMDDIAAAVADDGTREGL
jgi:hypothetical protein